MSDHIRNVAETARRGYYIRQPIPQCSVPVTLIDGVTSFISYPLNSTDMTSQCQLNKIRLYPYGSFYPIVNYNKYDVIPGYK
jgi:hypothetical protein